MKITETKIKDLFVLEPEIFEDIKSISAALNNFEASEDLFECERILKRREEFGDFDYYDPQVILSNDREFKNDWIKLSIDIYYRGEIKSNSDFEEEKRNFIPHGRGFFLRKREIYEGYFDNGQREGLGREINLRHSYTGYWFRGKKWGFGAKNRTDSIYVGEFENDLQHGTGYLRTPIATYRWDWKKGKQNGIGVLKFKDGRVYNGDFFDGVIQGYGSIIWPNGKCISGYWKNGEISGESKQIRIKEDERPSRMSSDNDEIERPESVNDNPRELIKKLTLLKDEIFE